MADEHASAPANASRVAARRARAMAEKARRAKLRRGRAHTWLRGAAASNGRGDDREPTSTSQLAADVARDGIGLELLDSDRDVVAEVFRSDAKRCWTIACRNPPSGSGTRSRICLCELCLDGIAHASPRRMARRAAALGRGGDSKKREGVPM